MHGNSANEMHVVYASDNNFAEIMGVSIVSLLENNKDMGKIIIYILDSGINNENKKNVEKVFQTYNRPKPLWIPAININNVLGIEVKQDRGSISQFARLFISRVLPNDLERVLYLDCDILIDKPLDELWNMDMQDKIIAALLDPFSPLYRKNLGLKDNDILFNSGVMLIDFKKWKSENIEDQLLNLIKKYNGMIPQGDQGALGAILGGNTALLNPKFNAITMFYDFTYENMLIYRKPPYYYSKELITEARKNPVIIHFTTSFLSRRAWIEGSKHPFTGKWIEYKGLSPWKDKPVHKYIEKRSVKEVYVQLYKVMPLWISVRLSGILQAYGRPIKEKIKYKI
ncbi:glycosyl transferase family 8 [Sedimentibacter sp. SX930]|nr:glycosyl transferase family 8 [Sedimentibacter sp. SX930]